MTGENHSEDANQSPEVYDFDRKAQEPVSLYPNGSYDALGSAMLAGLVKLGTDETGPIATTPAEEPAADEQTAHHRFRLPRSLHRHPKAS